MSKRLRKQVWLNRTIESAQKGESLSHKLSITIIGSANAGKSTLLNRLADKNVSIVHEEAGTTRDIIYPLLPWEICKLNFLIQQE